MLLQHFLRLLLALPVWALLLARPALAQSTQTIDLRPHWDSTTVLRNPHKGWYHHYYDNTTGAYLTRADSDLDNFPGLNHLFLRFAWSYLEPTEGTFNWALIDDVVKKWVAKGYTISFSITCKETGITYATPEWVKNAGAKGAFFSPWGVSNWEPDYGDPVFLAKLDNFHKAFAARYNGAAWLESVTVGSFGDWGEGHTTFSSNRDWPVAVIQKHFDLYRKYYTVPVYLSDDFVGGRHANDGSAAQVEAYANQLGFSWRDDSMLVKWYTENNAATHSIRTPHLFTSSWTTRPTLLEAQHYYLQKQDGVWQGPDGTTKGAAMMLGALRLTHATYIGYHGYADEWLKENPNLARKIANLAGYWYFPRTAVLPASLVSGSTGSLQLAWENHGVAPAYHRYKLKMRLVDPSGKSYTQDLHEADNRTWQPGTATPETYALPVPAGAVAGTYQVKVALVEERNGTSTLVKLALKDASKDADGFYQLGTLAVTAPATALAAGMYTLTARHSGKVLGISGGSTANGAVAEQQTYTGSTSQHWQVTSVGNGYYMLLAQHSGKALALDLNSATNGGYTDATANGVRVFQFGTSSTDNRQWKIEVTADGYYKLTNKRSGKVLDIAGGSGATAEGIAAIQWAYGGRDNQQWKLVPVAASSASSPAASFADAAQPALVVYPNPVMEASTRLLLVRYVASRAQTARLTVLNAQGRPVYSQPVDLHAGLNEVELPAAQPLRGGLHVVRLFADGRAFTQQLHVTQ